MMTFPTMKKAAAYLLAFAAGSAGAWCFTEVLDDGRDPEENSRQSLQPDKPGKLSSRSGNRPSRSQAPAGSAHRQAWELLLRQPPKDRNSLTPDLLKQWIEIDPAGALEAVLAEDESAQWLNLFSPLFEKDPAGFRNLFADERFGLGTEKVRDWWINRMAYKSPAELLSLASGFGTLTRDKIAATCVELQKNDPGRLRALIGAASTLPDSPENRQIASSLARALASHLDSQELLDRLIELPGALRAAMIGGAMATMLDRTDIQGAKATFASLPDDLRQAAIEATLAKPGRNVSGYLAAIDEVIHAPGWSELKGSLAVRLHELAPGADQNPTLLEWAARMPEREDTMDLYRVAVRSFVTHNPQDAREWIGGMEPGWKQQNSLASYVQSALAARSDEAGAQWAFQQITDPVFRAEAQDFFQAHEARQGKR